MAAGAFVAGAIVSKLVLDKTDWDKKVKAVEGQVPKLGAKFGKAGQSLTRGITLPLAAAGAAAVKVGAQFEQSIVNALSVTGDSSEKTKARMESLARTMGKDTVFSASQAADAMYFMASAGWKVDDMEKALNSTLNLAAATQSDLAYTTDTVVASLSQFQLGSEGAARVSNVFAAAISGSQATMTKLGTSMTYVGPIANSLGISIEQTTASLMGMYNAGFDASQAGTALRMAFAKLVKPTKETAAGLGSLGLTFDDVNPKTKSMADIVDLLGKRGADTEAIIKIFGVRAGPAMAALLAQGGDALRQYEADVTGTNRASEMATQQVDTFQGSIKLMKSALEEGAIAVSKTLAPILRQLVDDVIKPAVQWFNNLSDSKKELIVKVGLAAAALGPLMAIMGRMMIALPRLVAGIKLVGVAIKGLAGPIGIVTAAAVGAYKVINDLIDSKSKMVDADHRAFNAEHKLMQKLRQAADAAGMSRLEFVKLSREYGNNAAKLALAIKRGQEGKALQEGLAEVTKKSREEYEKKNATLKTTIPTVSDLAKEIQAVGTQTAATSEKTKTYLNYISDLGLKTINEKSARVSELEGYLEALHKAYKDGVIDLETYQAATKKAKEEIAELGTIAETTVPKARDLSDVYGLAVDTMSGKTETFVASAKSGTQEVLFKWSDMTDGLKTKWSTTISDILTGATSFKDGVKGALEAVKTQFFDIVGQLASKFMTGFIEKGLSGIGKLAGSLVDDIGGALSSIFSGGSGGGGIAGNALSTLTSAAANFSPAGIIGNVAGGIVSGLASLVSGSKTKGAIDASNRELHNIWIEARNILNNVDNIKWIGDDIKKTGWQMNDRIGSLQKIGWNHSKFLKEIIANTSAAVKELRGKKTAQSGAVVKTNEMVFAHGTANKPEYILPHDDLMRVIQGGGGGGNGGGSSPPIINVRLVNRNTFENQVDPNFTERFAEEMMRSFLHLLDTNRFRSLFQEKLGLGAS